jgi:hypothetical protein
MFFSSKFTAKFYSLQSIKSTQTQICCKVWTFPKTNPQNRTIKDMHLLLHIPTKSPRKSKKRPHFLLHNSPGCDPNSLEKKIPPCYYAIPHSTSPTKIFFTQEQISRTGSLNQLNFTFLSRPSFAHHISHSLSTFTLLFLFSCWYMHNKTCSKCETNQTDYKNTDTEVAKANPTSSKSFSELGNIF